MTKGDSYLPEAREGSTLTDLVNGGPCPHCGAGPSAFFVELEDDVTCAICSRTVYTNVRPEEIHRLRTRAYHLDGAKHYPAAPARFIMADHNPMLLVACRETGRRSCPFSAWGYVDDWIRWDMGVSNSYARAWAIMCRQGHRLMVGTDRLARPTWWRHLSVNRQRKWDT